LCDYANTTAWPVSTATGPPPIPTSPAPTAQHRPAVERSIAWIVRGNRRLRYRGVTANDSWLHLRLTAVNLRRLTNLGLHHTDTTWALA